MIDKYCIIIDDRDQSANLKKISRILQEEHGINFIYSQINPSESKYQSLDLESETPRVDLKKIEQELIGITFFNRANTIAIDYNLVEHNLNGFQIAMLIRKLGYKLNKELLLYSARLEKAISTILSEGELADKLDNLKFLHTGNLEFIERVEYVNEIVARIRKEPGFNFENELTNWLYKFGDKTFINIFPPFEGYLLSRIAHEIDANTHESQEFKRAIIEQTFSILIQINELD